MGPNTRPQCVSCDERRENVVKDNQEMRAVVRSESNKNKYTDTKLRNNIAESK